MSDHWYDTQGWYEPLNRKTEDQTLLHSDHTDSGGEGLHPAASQPARKTKKTWPDKDTKTRVRIISLVLVVLLLIAATSAIFGKMGSAVTFPLPDEKEEEELPDNPKEFFEQFYEPMEDNSTAEYRIERAGLPIDFTLAPVSSGIELTLQELYETCEPTIVGISAYTDKVSGYSWGSGIIISSDGLILTNAHVVEGSDSAKVSFSDGTEYDALLVGADSISDIAVLKIDAADLPIAEFGDSSGLRVGDRVAAIGNPLGETLRSTLTNGIISAIERGVSYKGRSMTLLQTNTAINEGNSGGALFNMYGQVIGITNMKIMSSYSSIEGIGFAIPSATVCAVVNSLVQHGEVTGRTAIGITVGEIPETAKDKYDMPDGLYITSVSENSDAKAKGLKPGDVVTAVNGTPVTTTEEISKIKDSFHVGDILVFTIWREGRTMEVEVALVDINDVYG